MTKKDSIKLTKEQAEFLNQILPKFGKGRNHNISVETSKYMIDLLVERLCENGIDTEGEVNKHGAFIDDLVSVFNQIVLDDEDK